jgi:sortase A
VTECAHSIVWRPVRLSRRFIFNALSLGLLVVATVMLGKSCWIHVKAQVAQVLLERAFDESVTTGKQVKPWNWADMWPVARISVPRLDKSAVVLAGTSGEALAFGPGLMNETSGIGERGTTVIAAHRDTHFYFLKFVQTGDVIEVVRNDGLKFKYQVTGMRITEWNQSGIDRRKNGFNLVLSTCFPFDSITHGSARYIVEASMIQ